MAHEYRVYKLGSDTELAYFDAPTDEDAIATACEWLHAGSLELRQAGRLVTRISRSRGPDDDD